MKIFQVISRVHSSGGAERMVIDLCNELYHLNNEVVLVTFYDVLPDSVYMQSLNKRVRHISLHKRRGFDFTLPIKILKFLLKEKPDIVNTHLSAVLPYFFISILLCFRVRFFHTIHNLAEREEPRSFMRLIRLFFMKIRRIVFVSISENTYNSFLSYYKSKWTELVRNGRSPIVFSSATKKVKEELEILKRDENTRIYLSIGRIAEQKNFGLLIDAFRCLYEKKENVLLLLIGEEYSNEKAITKELNERKAPNTYLLGAKSNIGDYLLNVDCFCLSSTHEGLPITILESLSVGVPIVSTAVGGIKDIVVDGENGFLCTTLNVEDYVQTILKLEKLTTKELDKIRDNNKCLFDSKYSSKMMGENYFTIYKKYL